MLSLIFDVFSTKVCSYNGPLLKSVSIALGDAS